MNDPSYLIRPNYKQKFRPAVVSQLIHQILVAKLHSQTYNPDTCSQYTREIADEIKHKLKDCDFDRYKFIVNVVMGEIRGEGVKVGARCFWDSDTDNMGQDTFINDSLFCVAAGRTTSF
ncbi:Tctex-1 family-domain-containing protein [Globomyces pollinis-pini]|nr:Tctex-1 family-domain-containing protein [Globomyces pollinis-pini]